MILFLLAWFDWQVVKNDNFTVFYKSDYHWEAYEFLKNLEDYRDSALTLTGNDTKPVRTVIEDLGCYSNGIADPLINKIQLFTYPDNINESMALQQSWHRAVAYHELIHILHMNKTTGLSKTMNAIFGNIFSPNMYAPMWLIEGLAVYGESSISSYEGRLNDGYYDRYMKIRARSLPDLVEITNEPLAFPVDQSYLYGGQFIQYLANRYGKRRIERHLDIYSRYFWAPLAVILPVIGIDCSMRKATGKSFPAAFRDFKVAQTCTANDPFSRENRLTDHGWHIGSAINHDNNIIFDRRSLVKAGPFDIFENSVINKYNTRTADEKILIRISSAPTSPLRVHDDKLFYAVREIERGQANSHFRGFGYTSRLYSYDLTTQRKEFLLQRDIRTFCIASDGSLLFACDRDHAYGSELWRGYPDPEKILETEYIIHDLLANDRYIIAAAARYNDNPDLCIIDTVSAEVLPIMATPWNEGQISFKDESTVLFVSNYLGEHAAYELNLTDRTCYRITESFAHWPIFTDDFIYYTGLNASGFDLYKIPYEAESFLFPEIPVKNMPLALNNAGIRPGNCWDFLKTLEPAARVPGIYPVNKDLTSWQPGCLVFGADIALENIYTLLLTYDNHEQSLYYNFNWRSNMLMPLGLNFRTVPDIFEISFSYPVHIQLRPGLNNLNVFIDFRSFDDYRRKEFAPAVSLRFECVPNYYFFQVRMPFERQSWYSHIDRSALQLSSGMKLRARSRSLYMLLLYYRDPDNPDPPCVPLRGFGDLLSSEALVLSNNIDHKLFSLRRGLWNPNLYIEDLFGAVFLDMAIDQDKALYWAVGIELKAEVKAGLGYIKLLPSVGLSVNDDREIRLFFKLQPAVEIPY